MPAPSAAVLSDPNRAPGAPVHEVEPSTVPTNGLRLQRRFVMARRTDGTPVLWVQRRRLPLLTPPAKLVRFDVLSS